MRESGFQSLRDSMLTIESKSKKHYRLQIGQSPLVNIKNHCGLVMQELSVVNSMKMVMKVSDRCSKSYDYVGSWLTFKARSNQIGHTKWKKYSFTVFNDGRNKSITLTPGIRNHAGCILLTGVRDERERERERESKNEGGKGIDLSLFDCDRIWFLHLCWPLGLWLMRERLRCGVVEACKIRDTSSIDPV